MIAGYKTALEAANEWGIEVRTVQVMCADGKIEGAAKFGKSWAIPIDAERPTDGRVKSGLYRDWRKK